MICRCVILTLVHSVNVKILVQLCLFFSFSWFLNPADLNWQEIMNLSSSQAECAMGFLEYKLFASSRIHNGMLGLMQEVGNSDVWVWGCKVFCSFESNTASPKHLNYQPLVNALLLSWWILLGLKEQLEVCLTCSGLLAGIQMLLLFQKLRCSNNKMILLTISIVPWIWDFCD